MAGSTTAQRRGMTGYALATSARGPLNPIVHETAQERVYRELRKALIHGKFGPGQPLLVHELASALDVGAALVRDALARLVFERALEPMSNRSVRVPPLELARIDDLFRARLVVEGAALDLAGPRLTSGDFEALRAINADYLRVASERGEARIDTALNANRAFHFHLYRAAGSDALPPIIESLWLQSAPLVRLAIIVFDPDGPLSAPHFHEEIVAALEARNVCAARDALAKDLGRAFCLLRKLAEDEAARCAPRTRNAQ